MHAYYSSPGKIIRAFQDHPGMPLSVSYFQKGNYFVGYKANSRINELVREGILDRSFVDLIGNKGQHFAQYLLTKKGQEYDIPSPKLSERILHFFNI